MDDPVVLGDPDDPVVLDDPDDPVVLDDPAAPVVIHSLEDALAAVDAAINKPDRVRLISAPGAVASLGSMAFVEIVRAVRAAHPTKTIDAILDCADAPGLALNALRHGAEIIRLDAAPDVLAKVQAIADTTKARVIDANTESPLS